MRIITFHSVTTTVICFVLTLLVVNACSMNSHSHPQDPGIAEIQALVKIERGRITVTALAVEANTGTSRILLKMIKQINETLPQLSRGQLETKTMLEELLKTLESVKLALAPDPRVTLGELVEEDLIIVIDEDGNYVIDEDGNYTYPNGSYILRDDG